MTQQQESLEYQVVVPSVFVFDAEQPHGRPVTELLYGETVAVAHEDETCVYGFIPGEPSMCRIERKALARTTSNPTHVVTKRSTNVRVDHGFKDVPILSLSYGSRVTVSESRNGSCLVPGLGWIQSAHVLPLAGRRDYDWVCGAEAYLGADYVWGGRSGVTGTDCSGLVVTAARVLGLCLPHKASLIEQLCVAHGESAPRERGVLVFWEGHVGIMSDEDHIIHATGEHAVRSVVEERYRHVVRERGHPRTRGHLPS